MDHPSSAPQGPRKTPPAPGHPKRHDPEREVAERQAPEREVAERQDPEREVADANEHRSAFDGRCEQAWASVLGHLGAHDRYVVVTDEGINTVFWAESNGSWYRMGATAIDPGFGEPPYAQVEFHLGNMDQVDLVTVARGSADIGTVAGVLILDQSVRLFANRDLASLDHRQFDQMTASIGSQIMSYRLAMDGDPPPSGNWSDRPPTLD